ncbi:kinesin-like protein, partial [Trypanosoma theileri]
EVERSLESMTAERDGLQQRLTSTSEELSEQLQTMEQAKAEVERSLESMTAERDGLQQRLTSTSEELSEQLQTMEQAKSEVLQLKRENESLASELKKSLVQCESANVRLNLWRSNGKLNDGQSFVSEYPLTRSVVGLKK